MLSKQCQELSLGHDSRAPALSSRPWFLSLLPSADVERTEISLNAAQRRVTGFIQFVTGRPLSAKDVKTTAADASQEHPAAAKASTVEEVKNRISSSADINRVDDRGMSATMYAAERGDIDTLKALVTAGSNINLVNGEGEDALLLAAKNGRAGIIEYLLARGADITRVDTAGCTAFVLSARAGKTAVIQSFIDAGVDIDAPAVNGCTPLMFAAEGGHVEFLEQLIANGANANKINMQHQMTAMMYAAQKGLTEVVKLFLEHGANADEESTTGQNALILAAENDYDSTVISLIEGGANQDKALLAVLKYKAHIGIPIVRAWLNSKKNKFDAFKAINCCTLKAVTPVPGPTHFSENAISALAEGGLTLTKNQLAELKQTLRLDSKALQLLKEHFVDGHISEVAKVRNAYWSGNHAVVDAANNAPEKTKSNPLGLNISEVLKAEHITRETVNICTRLASCLINHGIFISTRKWTAC
jgi:ankyrin repeat protein